jgi:hydroxyacylglutathione hydrolase
MRIKTIAVGILDTNCYIISSGAEAWVIDPGDDALRLLDYCAENELSVRAVLLTHGHADHIGAAADFHVPVYIHKLDADCLNDASANLSSFVGAPFVCPADLEVESLEDGMNLILADGNFVVFHTPGHTQGCVCFYCREEGVLFSGDTLFAGSIGRTDLPEGSYDSIINSIRQKLLVLPDETKVYPGHGASTTIGKERLDNPFLIP